MTPTLTWETLTAVVGIASAVCGPPLGVILFYVRGFREDQRAANAMLQRRIEQLEEDLRRMAASLEAIQRGYTTKDEWVRETMLARKQLERLGELLARVQADMENARHLASQFGRATAAIIDLADRVGGRT